MLATVDDDDDCDDDHDMAMMMMMTTMTMTMMMMVYEEKWQLVVTCQCCLHSLSISNARQMQ